MHKKFLTLRLGIFYSLFLFAFRMAALRNQEAATASPGLLHVPCAGVISGEHPITPLESERYRISHSNTVWSGKRIKYNLLLLRFSSPAVHGLIPLRLAGYRWHMNKRILISMN